MGLLVACTDEEEENGTTDNGSISENESVVKMTVDIRDNSFLKIELDGKEFNERWDEPYMSQYKTDFESIPFPKDLTVNWGDGTETNSNTHQYALEGNYQITLKCKELRSLYISNRVKDIDLSQAKDLEYLNLGYYKNSIVLKSLDLSKNKKLKFLSIDGAPLIDVSEHSELIYLSYNSIQGEFNKLDFSKNTKLVYLNLSCRNEITSLNIKGCNELVYLALDSKDFSDEAANTVYNDLPKGKTWEYKYSEYMSYVNVGYKRMNGKYLPIGDFSVAEIKGWEIEYIS